MCSFLICYYLSCLITNHSMMGGVDMLPLDPHQWALDEYCQKVSPVLLTAQKHTNTGCKLRFGDVHSECFANLCADHSFFLHVPANFMVATNTLLVSVCKRQAPVVFQFIFFSFNYIFSIVLHSQSILLL